MITLGQLADQLAALAEAEQDLADAQRNVGFGGAPDTMRAKHETVEACNRRLRYLRDQQLGGDDA